MSRVIRSSAMAVAMVLTLAGCSDEALEPGGPDAVTADLAPDARVDREPDPQGPDLAKDSGPDTPRPDLPSGDLALPDSAAPDLPAPDLPAPDLPAPDLPAPDLPAPDMAPPDTGNDAMCSGDAARPCYAGPASTKNVGLCKAGSQICSLGLWGACAGAVLPQTEVCDGQDNNCDGATDEKLTCVSTVAGVGASHRDGPAAQATFASPYCIAVAANGDLLVGDSLNYRVRRISGGKVTTIAGSGIYGGANGAALDASFSHIWDLTVTAAGDVVVAEAFDNRIRKISGGQVTTLAGDGVAGYKDGPAKTARFSAPYSVLAVGNDVLVADRNNHRIRKISGGQVSTHAGTGVKGLSGGTLLKAQFTYPWGLAKDSTGAVYVGAYTGGPVRKISGGQVFTLAGSSSTGHKDGPAPIALFSSPRSLAAGIKGVFVLDAGDSRVRKIAGGQVSTVLGDGTPGYVDGPLAKARLGLAYGIRFTTAGDLVVSDTVNNVIRQISLGKGTVSTLAGVSPGGYKDGPVAAAAFSSPTGLAVGPAGEIYVADQHNSVVRKISGGKVSTFAGSGVRGHKDGPALSAQLGAVSDVALGPKGELYLTELVNRRVRKVQAGQVTTLAGSGAKGHKDGPALSAEFRMLTALKVDKQGAVYVVDTANRAIRKISGGQVTTIAGTGKLGYLDGPALSAKFAGPFGLALGPAGEVYVGDSGNRRVRLLSKGQVTTVAGDGTRGCKDGPALKAQFGQIFKLDIGPGGELYISDNGCSQIRKLHKGQVTTVAGAMKVGLQDGLAKDAMFARPHAVIWGGANSLLVGDTANHRVRRISW